jgi:extracellular factor (EF) 3-hydroxypalmitic acid methyl ester biosynthesis protein
MVTQFAYHPNDTSPTSGGYFRAVRRLTAFLATAKDLLATEELRPTLAARSASLRLGRELAELLGAFELQARAVSDEAKHRAFAQAELHPYLLESPFAARTYTKPLGYAGDYEMVNMMLGESKSVADGAFAQLVDEVLRNVPVAHAHKNRISILESTLLEEATRVNADGRMCSIVSVGCGPAVEIQRLLGRGELGGSILHLVDFNEQTLEYVDSRTKSILAGVARRPIVRLLRQSLEEVATGSGAAKPRRATYDLVYCTGLFDYFNDEMCRQLTREYVSWLRPGGVLVTSNVHPSNPHRQCMEHLVEWFLVYRDEEQMRALAPPGSNPRIFTDGTGLNVFSSIRV